MKIHYGVISDLQNDKDPLITAKLFATKIGFSITWVMNKINEGEIKATHLIKWKKATKGEWFIPTSELDKF